MGTREEVQDLILNLIRRKDIFIDSWEDAFFYYLEKYDFRGSKDADHIAGHFYYVFEELKEIGEIRRVIYRSKHKKGWNLCYRPESEGHQTFDEAILDIVKYDGPFETKKQLVKFLKSKGIRQIKSSDVGKAFDRLRIVKRNGIYEQHRGLGNPTRERRRQLIQHALDDGSIAYQHQLTKVFEDKGYNVPSPMTISKDLEALGAEKIDGVYTQLSPNLSEKATLQLIKAFKQKGIRLPRSTFGNPNKICAVLRKLAFQQADIQKLAEIHHHYSQEASNSSQKQGRQEFDIWFSNLLKKAQEQHPETQAYQEMLQTSGTRRTGKDKGTTLNSSLAFAETALPAKWQAKIDAIPGFFYDDRGPSVVSRVYTAVKPKVKGAVKAVAHELTPPTNPKVYATGPLSYMVNNGQTDMALMILVSAAMPETMRDHGRTVENGLPFVTAPIEHYIIGTTGGAGFCATTSQIVRYYVLPRVTSWSHTVGKVTTNTVKATGSALKTTGIAMATVPLTETAAVAGGVAVMGLTMYAVANIPIEEATTPDQIRTLLNAGHITLDQAFTATALDGDNKPYVVFSVDTNKLDDVLNKLLPTDSHLAFHVTDNGKVSRLKTTPAISTPKTWGTEKDVELNFTLPATLEKLKESIVPQNLTAPTSKKQKEAIVPQNQLALVVRK